MTLITDATSSRMHRREPAVLQPTATRHRMLRNLLFGCLTFFMALGGPPPAAHAQQEARLRVGDVILIRLSGVPADETAMFGEMRLADDGTINLPWIGRIQAAGMTASQLQRSIEERYVSEQIYSNPTVIITGQDAARFVNVGGAVRAPQRVSWTPDMTLLTAINAAGGFNDFANQKRVRLLRSGQASTHNVAEFRADPSRDIPVQPGDTIEVPQKLF